MRAQLAFRTGCARARASRGVHFEVLKRELALKVPRRQARLHGGEGGRIGHHLHRPRVGGGATVRTRRSTPSRNRYGGVTPSFVKATGLEKRNGDEEERVAAEQVSFSADRREGQGARRLAGETLSRLRTLVKEADPEVVEEWKWRGVPVWSHDGMICTGETYKNVVKMTFAKGAALEDPSGLFNSSLDGNTRRAIDFHEEGR